jgi:hypothetical protein
VNTRELSAMEDHIRNERERDKAAGGREVLALMSHAAFCKLLDRSSIRGVAKTMGHCFHDRPLHDFPTSPKRGN